MVTQPDNFGFGDDEAMLRDSARRFFQDNASADKLHNLVATDHDPYRESLALWDRNLWQQIVDLGWTSACVPEHAGGIGMGRVAAVAIAEEAGRAAFPSPLLVTLQSTFVLDACKSQAADTVLESISGGIAITLATTDQNGSWEPSDTDVAVDAAGMLNGVASYVQDARKCSSFIVSAKGEGGVGLYLVDGDAAGVSIMPDHITDLTRDQASVSFKNVRAIELAPQGAGEAALNAALPSMLAVLSADMVGAGEWLLQTTAEYAKTRVQFDRPIGFFQAIKHPLVNLMIEIDDAKSLTYNAACAADVGDKSALDLARMAKSRASDMAVYSASRAVQLHGGIAFTWEAYVHIFFKRQMHSQTLLGDARYHRTLLADVLIDDAE